MEKRTPHYRLDKIKEAIVQRGITAFTKSSIDGAAQMGLNSSEMIAVVLSVDNSMFYKSMTTYADHRVWQDVYHIPTKVGLAYVKFTLRTEGAIVISFKSL